MTISEYINVSGTERRVHVHIPSLSSLSFSPAFPLACRFFPLPFSPRTPPRGKLHYLSTPTNPSIRAARDVFRFILQWTLNSRADYSVGRECTKIIKEISFATNHYWTRATRQTISHGHIRVKPTISISLLYDGPREIFVLAPSPRSGFRFQLTRYKTPNAARAGRTRFTGIMIVP